MRALHRFFSRVRSFATRRRNDDRLRDELEQHVALQTEENVRCGMSPEEGRRQALLKLGGIEAVREQYYEEKSLPVPQPCARLCTRSIKDQSISSVATMKQLVNNSLATRRMTLVLLGLFSVLALTLGTIGIYGVISYSVAQRTREIGVRIVLGASRGAVFWMVMGQGVKLAGTGIAIGILAALGLARLMSSLLYEVSTADSETFTAVAVLLLLVAIAAPYVPARRAILVEPMVALRYE